MGITVMLEQNVQWTEPICMESLFVEQHVESSRTKQTARINFPHRWGQCSMNLFVQVSPKFQYNFVQNDLTKRTLMFLHFV